MLDSKLRHHPGAFLAQCGLATVVLMVPFTVEDVLPHAAIFAAIGSTTFVVFATPSSPNATPLRVIGGHLVGVVTGSLSSLFLACSLGVSR